MTGRTVIGNGRGLFGQNVINTNKKRHYSYQMHTEKCVIMRQCVVNRNRFNL